ncbi:MAG: hypothetical protein JXB85_15805 [Anaerolineales bacterium]|nr:hypothetical protein [Anaerolineales bacterium]
MAEHSICSNCGNKLKEQWLVCKYCHQARWKRILPYYFGGVAFLTITLLSLPRWENSVFQCIGALTGLLGAVMLLMGGIATLRGLSVRKVTPAPQATSASPAAAPVPTASTPAAPDTYVRPPMVDRIGSFSYTRTDEDRIRNIVYNIQQANHEPGWDNLNLQAGHVERGKIPDYTREIIDYLLDGHVPTHDTTLAKLFKEGEPKLRETIIRILGAMGTENSLTTLEAFAAKDPLQVNEDDQYNSTSGSSAPLSVTWGMPLRELAKEEIQKVKAGLKAGS